MTAPAFAESAARTVPDYQTPADPDPAAEVALRMAERAPGSVLVASEDEWFRFFAN